MRIGFVGAGQLANVLAPALAQAGYTVAAVASTEQADAEALAKRLPGAQALPTPQAVAEAADLIFLTTPDDAIAAVAGSIRWRPETAAVHCSGTFGLELLSTASSQGAATGSFHPLQTFAGGQGDLAGVTVAIEATDGLLATLTGMATA